MNGTLGHNNKLIWILEDDKNCQFVYEQVLDFRYKTRYFESIDTFAAALRECRDNLPALIIADLLLPDGNFLNFLTESKENELLTIPFIIVSSIDDIDALRFCFNEGALDYLTKPFKKNEILVKIENILSGRSSRTIITGDSKDVTLDGVKINNLTSKQLQVLSLFLHSPMRTVNRGDILKKVWGSTTVHPYGYMIRSEGGGKWALLAERLGASEMIQDAPVC